MTRPRIVKDGLMSDTANHQPEDLDDDHNVPAELVELFEVLEWQAAVDEQNEATVRDMEGLE